MSVVAPRAISFDLSTETQFADARNSRATKMNVRRTTDSEGRSRTSYLIDDAQRFAGSGCNARRLGRVGVDENVDATAYCADGTNRRFPLDPSGIATAIGALPALPTAVRSAVDKATALQSRSAPVDGKMTGKWTEAVATTPEARRIAVAALAAKSSQVRRGPQGSDVFVTVDGARTVEVEIDNTNNLVRRATFQEQDQVIARLDYDWTAADNDIFVRNAAELSRTGNQKGGAIRSKVALSNIMIDGQEVRP